jgi:hypothetical protein
MWSHPDRSLDHLKKLYFVPLFLYIFILQKQTNNSFCSPGTAVFITRKNAFSAEMEVCVIFYISMNLDVVDSNKKPICSSWYGLQFISLQVFNQLTSSRPNLAWHLPIDFGKKLFWPSKTNGSGKYQVCGFYSLLLPIWGIYSRSFEPRIYFLKFCKSFQTLLSPRIGNFYYLISPVGQLRKFWNS